MPLYGASSSLRPSTDSGTEQHRCAKPHLTLEDLLDSSVIGQDKEDQITRPSSHATQSASSAVAYYSNKGSSSLYAASQRVPVIIANVVGMLPDCGQSSRQVVTNVPSSYPASTCYAGPAYHPYLRCPAPRPLAPFNAENFFDRNNWRINLPFTLVAILQVNEWSDTVYFTSPDRVPYLPLAVSTRVVYATAQRHPDLDIDLLNMQLKDNQIRPLSKDVLETSWRLYELNTRLMRHRQRQGDFIRAARAYSDNRNLSCAARDLTPGHDATASIPGIPYLESYIHKLAFEQACLVEEIVKGFDPPSMVLRFVA